MLLTLLNAITFETMKCMARQFPWAFFVKHLVHFINLEIRDIITLGKTMSVTKWKEHKFQVSYKNVLSPVPLTSITILSIVLM